MANLTGRGGKPLGWRKIRSLKQLESSLLQRRRIDETSGCWLWLGARNSAGYGSVGYDGRVQSVHRLAAILWLNFDGDSTKDICHHCDNPPCFNPSHLYIGDNYTNTIDRKQRGRARYLRGEENGNAHLSFVDVQLIRKALELGTSQHQLASLFGVAQGTIWGIAHEKHWAA